LLDGPPGVVVPAAFGVPAPLVVPAESVGPAVAPGTPVGDAPFGPPGEVPSGLFWVPSGPTEVGAGPAEVGPAGTGLSPGPAVTGDVGPLGPNGSVEFPTGMVGDG
jgi:hypothetical protein